MEGRVTLGKAPVTSRLLQNPHARERDPPPSPPAQAFLKNLQEEGGFSPGVGAQDVPAPVPGLL